MAHSDGVYLEHILDAIRRIELYSSESDQLTFRATPMMQDAIIRQLEIIGEATKKLSEDSRRRYPSIPWRDLAGMRDKLIHQYFGVDIDMVWQTVLEDIPTLKETLLNAPEG